MDAIDFIFGLCVVAVLTLVGFAIFSFGQGTENNRQFNNWAALCREEGGSVDFWGTNSRGQQYECIKDGKVINHMD